ncbi:MAG: sodium:solute symporter family protein [Calditrichaeota bacterium]|nr:sodium:solute symporter family protein [Calditrichota bacterium]
MIYLIVIIVYFALLFGVGLFFSFRVKNQDDFMVAGRKLTWPILVGTLLATWIGSGDIFSVSDLSYHHGYSSLLGSAGGWLGIIVVFFIAGRVRTFGQYTVPDILEVRYNKWARLLATLTTIIAYVTIVSYQFRGGGWVLNIISNGMFSPDTHYQISLFGDKFFLPIIQSGQIPMQTAMLLVAFFVVLYTLTAGMMSVAYLDIINGMMIILGVFLAIPFLIHHVGGMEYIEANLPARRNPILGNMTTIQALGYFIPTLLLALGNGNMYQRFYSAKNPGEAKKSVVGWVIGVIVIGVALQSLAVIGSSFFKNLSPTEAGKIIVLVAYQGVPVAVGCILIAAIVAIIISTANSFLLVPATNIMRDIYQRFIDPNISDKKMVLFLRIAVIFLGVAAYLLMQFFPRILDAAYAAYTIYGAGLTPALLATFFWKRATAHAGVASILTGMGITVIWEIARKIQGDLLFGVPAIYPALVGSVFMLVVISLLENPPQEKKWQPFFSD